MLQEAAKFPQVSFSARERDILPHPDVARNSLKSQREFW